MSSNFLQWNPTEANQETDAAYNSDALRSGGAMVGAIFPSATANKLFFQLSTMVTALANFIVAQGGTAEDANLATLLTNLTDALENIAESVSAPDQVDYTITANGELSITVPSNSCVTVRVALNGGSVTSSTISGIQPGQIVTLAVGTPNSGTGWSFNFPPNFLNPASIPSVAANRIYVQSFIVYSPYTVYDPSPILIPIGPQIVVVGVM